MNTTEKAQTTDTTTRMPTWFIPHGGGPCFFMDWMSIPLKATTHSGAKQATDSGPKWPPVPAMRPGSPASATRGWHC